MSKLKELVNKGVRLIVVESEAAGSAGAAREVAAEDLVLAEPGPEPVSRMSADVADFGAVYDEAGIGLPDHGYGIDKVAEMLQGKRLASLAREVRATAVMAALDAAQVPFKDVIQDAVRRDRALDEFEAAKQRELAELKARSEQRITAIREELDALLRQKNAEIEDLRAAVEKATQAFASLQVRKRREEARLHDTVAYFVEGAPNPITATSPQAAEAGSPTPPSKK